VTRKKSRVIVFLAAVCLLVPVVSHGAMITDLDYDATKISFRIVRSPSDGDEAAGYYGVLGFNLDGRVVFRKPENMSVEEGMAKNPPVAGQFRIKRFKPVTIELKKPVLGWRILLWDRNGNLMEKKDLGLIGITRDANGIPENAVSISKPQAISTDSAEFEEVAHDLEKILNRLLLLYRQALHKANDLETENKRLLREAETSREALSACAGKKDELEKNILAVKKDYLELSMSCRDAEEQLRELLESYNLCMGYVKAMKDGGEGK